VSPRERGMEYIAAGRRKSRRISLVINLSTAAKNRTIGNGGSRMLPRTIGVIEKAAGDALTN